VSFPRWPRWRRRGARRRESSRRGERSSPGSSSCSRRRGSYWSGWVGRRRGGRTGSTGTEAHRRRGSNGEVVPVTGVPKGGKEVAEELLQDNVVLLVPLAGPEGLCSGELTVKPSGGGALSLPALWETMLGCGRVKLAGLGSTSGLSWCCRSIGSGLRGGSGGCRRQAVAAAEVRRETTLREKGMPLKRRAGVSKEDHGAAIGRVLRPGEVLRMRAGAGNGDDMRGGRQ
jgi:hypothetical protein